MHLGRGQVWHTWVGVYGMGKGSAGIHSGGGDGVQVLAAAFSAWHLDVGYV